jgi:hypothetical protein
MPPFIHHAILIHSLSVNTSSILIILWPRLSIHLPLSMHTYYPSAPFIHSFSLIHGYFLFMDAPPLVHCAIRIHSVNTSSHPSVPNCCRTGRTRPTVQVQFRFSPAERWAGSILGFQILKCLRTGLKPVQTFGLKFSIFLGSNEPLEVPISRILRPDEN